MCLPCFGDNRLGSSSQGGVLSFVLRVYVPGIRHCCAGMMLRWYSCHYDRNSRSSSFFVLSSTRVRIAVGCYSDFDRSPCFGAVKIWNWNLPSLVIIFYSRLSGVQIPVLLYAVVSVSIYQAISERFWNLQKMIRTLFPKYVLSCVLDAESDRFGLALLRTLAALWSEVWNM